MCEDEVTTANLICEGKHPINIVYFGHKFARNSVLFPQILRVVDVMPRDGSAGEDKWVRIVCHIIPLWGTIPCSCSVGPILCGSVQNHC